MRQKEVEGGLAGGGGGGGGGGLSSDIQAMAGQEVVAGRRGGGHGMAGGEMRCARLPPARRMPGGWQGRSSAPWQTGRNLWRSLLISLLNNVAARLASSTRGGVHSICLGVQREATRLSSLSADGRRGRHDGGDGATL